MTPAREMNHREMNITAATEKRTFWSNLHKHKTSERGNDHSKQIFHIDSLSFIAHHTMHYAGSDVVYYHRNTANVFLQRDWNGTRINENWIQSVFYLKTWTIDAKFAGECQLQLHFVSLELPVFCWAGLM